MSRSPQGGIRSRAAGPLRGTVRPIGDKSLTHRSLILAAIASGRSSIRRPNPGGDCAATARGLTLLGAEIRSAPDGWEVDGTAGALRDASDILDCGNSGTGIRLLAGLVAGRNAFAVLTGDASLRGRPMRRIAEPLARMGTEIWLRDGEYPPMAVRGGAIRPADLLLPMASAQVKGAILLAGLGLREGQVAVEEPGPSRDHTERMLSWLGYPIAREGRRVVLRGSAHLHGGLSWEVPSDASAACFYLVAALAVPGSDLTVEGVLLNPTRTGGIDVLRKMGGDLEIAEQSSAGPEPVATIRARHSALRGTTVTGNLTVRSLDEIPILAVAAALAEGETTIRDAAELRVKESDRIASTAALIHALGGEVETGPDWITIRGRGWLEGGWVETRGDHRIAMSALVAGCAARGEVRIDDGSAIDTSDPEFLATMARLGADLR